MGYTYFIFVWSLFLFVACQEVDSARYKGGIHVGEGVLYYANFVPFPNHKLNHSEVMETRSVIDEEECIAACTENMECQSANFNTTPDDSGQHICQLLDADKFTSYNEFTETLDFHHYSFTVRHVLE